MRTVGLVFPTSDSAGAADLFSCPNCGKEYKSKSALAKHMREQHAEVSGAEDTECDHSAGQDN